MDIQTREWRADHLGAPKWGPRLRWGGLWGAAFVAVLAWSNFEARAQDAALVGEKGRAEAIVMEGNTTFTREQILKGLVWSMHYYLASHRLAPLSNYVSRLEHWIRLGYQHEGFPDVKVTVTPETQADRIGIRVEEGPRYQLGAILLTGAASMTNEVVRKRIADVLAGFDENSSAQTNREQALWLEGNPAPMDPISQRAVPDGVRTALEALGYFQPKINVEFRRDPVRKIVDLRIDIADEGVKGKIQEIAVDGLEINTRRVLLDYLKLKPGMDFQGSLLQSISNRLWSSARFLRQEITLSPLEEVGQWKLALAVQELPKAPRLDKEISAEGKALLKFRDWLMAWPKGSEDLVFSFNSTSSWGRVDLEMVLSPSGIALIGRRGAARERPEVGYAVVGSAKGVGYYSPWRGHRYTPMGGKGGIRMSVSIGPNPDPQSDNQFNFNLMFGADSIEGASPVTILLDLMPAAFLDATFSKENQLVLDHGVLTARSAKQEQNEMLAITIEAATGRLIEVNGRNPECVFRVRPEAGGFARVVKEVSAAGAGIPNDYRTNAPVSTWLAYQITELLASPLLEALAEKWLIEDAEAERQTQMREQFAQVRAWKARAREFLPEQKLAKLFEPLDRLVASNVHDESEEDETFSVPKDEEDLKLFRNPMTVVSLVALQYCDQLLPPGTWPWMLLREGAFTLVGLGHYTGAELETLLGTGQLGPAGCLATATLLGRFEPKLARRFAERGSSNLTASAFRADYEILMQTNGLAGQTAANLLRLVRNFTEEQFARLTAELPSAEAAFVRQLARALHNAPDQAPAVASWPAWEAHWDPVWRRYLESGLTYFLPQVQSLTDPQALFERGRALADEDSVMKDFVEAAECFRKAADQGHGDAKVLLGMLYQDGLGVPQDTEEAIRWYHQAETQKALHAACKLGDLAMAGKGMKQDQAAATRWYRIDGERGCASAQFKTGWLLADQGKHKEAMDWYRRSAEQGFPQAQVQLAELYRDPVVTMPVDLVEACHWLILAVHEQSPRALIASLRGLKSKLSPEQLSEANKRAEATRKRIEENDKSKKPDSGGWSTTSSSPR